MSARVLLADSVTRLTEAHAGQVVVSGSHGGRIAAAYVARAAVRAAAFNDAGRGLDDAGVSGLPELDRAGIAAVAVAHTSARIGDAADTLASGIVSACNMPAADCGVREGMACREAMDCLRDARWNRGTVTMPAETRVTLVAAAAGQVAAVGLDSIGIVTGEDAGRVLVIASHGALHGGDPASALPVAARAAIFHDAGRGKEDAGVSRLPVLAARGMPAAAVDFRTARIGDARSLWASGVVSVANAPAHRAGVVPGMRVEDAVRVLLRSAWV